MQVTSKQNHEQDKAPDLSQLWLKYFAYWPVFVLLLLICVAAAWFYLNYSIPRYQASARILIKDETKGVDHSEALNFLNMIGTKKVLENEKEVIASKPLLSKVVLALHLYADIYQVNNMSHSSAYESSPVRIQAKNPEQIQNSDITRFSFDRASQTVSVEKVKYPLNQWALVGQDTIQFVQNPRYDGSAITHYYFRLINPNSAAAEIQSNLRVTPAGKMSTILNLSLKDQNPRRGEEILNRLMFEYDNTSLNDKNVLASNTLKFVQDRLELVSKELTDVESKMEAYKTNESAFDISTQGELFLQNVSQNDQALSGINMQLAVLKEVEQYVATKGAKGAIVPSTLGIDDQTLLNLLGLLYDAELQYERLKETEGENSASLIAVVNQIEKLRPNILESIQNLNINLQARKLNLQNTNEEYAASLNQIPRKEKELIQINREHTIISEIYSFLLEKREESALSYASTLPATTIVENAESSNEPVSPKPAIVYLLATLFPVIIGFGAVTVKESLNTKILFRHEIESVSNAPVSGEIAYSKSDSRIVIGKNKKTFIANQFRQLRVALKQHDGFNACKRILVTSSISGEGKSFVALNLAVSFALIGKKTAIIELDITNPAITSRTSVESTPGIFDYLRGISEAEEIVQRTPIHENLFVISAGTPIAEYSEILENGRINELISYYSEIFDCIIIDSAPVNSNTDASIVSSICDSTLFVIRHNYTPKVFIQRLDQIVNINQLKNLSVVFNGIKPRGFGRHLYGFGYGYGYVYNERKQNKVDVQVDN